MPPPELIGVPSLCHRYFRGSGFEKLGNPCFKGWATQTLQTISGSNDYCPSRALKASGPLCIALIVPPIVTPLSQVVITFFGRCTSGHRGGGVVSGVTARQDWLQSSRPHNFFCMCMGSLFCQKLDGTPVGTLCVCVYVCVCAVSVYLHCIVAVFLKA